MADGWPPKPPVGGQGTSSPSGGLPDCVITGLAVDVRINYISLYPNRDVRMPEMPKHRDVTVKLVGEDGSAFAIIGKVNRALKSAGYHESARAFMAEAMNGDYNHLLRTAMEYVVIE